MTTLPDTPSDSDTGSDDSPDDGADDGDSVVPTITAPEEEVAEESQRGGVLRVAMEADGDGINPVANNFERRSLMGQSIFDPLVARPERQLVPLIWRVRARLRARTRQITLRRGHVPRRFDDR